MFKRILVAYDGSEGSQAALDQAAKLAALHRSTLIIAHAVKEKPGVSTQATLPAGGYTGGTTLKSDRSETANEHGGGGISILKQAKKSVSLPDSHIETETLAGEHPAKELCDFASLKEADLIVMGNRGLHGIRKMMLGSVSQKVAQNAHCPVMIVK